MSRKTIYNSNPTLPPSSSSRSNSPSRTTLASSFPSSKEHNSQYNPYSLQDNVPGKALHSNRKSNASSGPGSSPAVGIGKNSGNVMSGASGGAEGQEDDSDSELSEDDEDADDDDDDDDDDKPAVRGPVSTEGEGYISTAEKGNGNGVNKNHLTGPPSKKRSYSTAMGDRSSNVEEDAAERSAAQDDDEPDYPRKKVAKGLSATNGLLAYSMQPAELHSNEQDGQSQTNNAIVNEERGEGNDNDHESSSSSSSDDDDDDMSGDDTDLEYSEEGVIVQDEDHKFTAETEDEGENGLLRSTDAEASDYGIDAELLNNNDFEDLDNEVFATNWNNPGLFTDHARSFGVEANYPFLNEEGIMGQDLFSANPSPATTPIVTSGPFTPTEDDESSEDVVDHNPFFERKDPILKYLVSTQGRGAWGGETDEEDLQCIFSPEDAKDSGEEFETDEEGSEEEYDAETDEDETDEDEDLPIATPQTKSRLRRASVSASPQIIRMNPPIKPGPILGSWVADADRPICIVDGKRKTYILPGKADRFSIEGQQGLFLDDSDSEDEVTPINYNPTLTGLTGGDGLFLNGSDILGPPEAFYPFANEETFFEKETYFDLSEGDLDDDEQVDKYESKLKIGDFLEISSEPEEVKSHVLGMALEDACEEEEDDEDEDECVAVDESAAMLAGWEKVGVTAFRRRQSQHAEKIAAQHAGQITSSHKGREGRLAETITPPRKKKLKQKFLAGGRAGGSPSGIRKNTSNNKWSPT